MHFEIYKTKKFHLKPDIFTARSWSDLDREYFGCKYAYNIRWLKWAVDLCF